MGRCCALYYRCSDLRLLVTPITPASNYQPRDVLVPLLLEAIFCAYRKLFIVDVIDAGARVSLDKIVSRTQHVSAGLPHARLDVHVGPGSAHCLFRGLPGPILIVRRVGGTVTSLDPTAPTAAGSALAPVYDFARSIQSLSGVTSSIVAYR